MPNIKIPSERLITVVPRFRVKYKDIFDIKSFYDALHEWLLEYEWKDREDGADHWETYYGERIDQSGAREIWWQWRCVKQPRDAPMLRYYLDFDVHCIAITSAEVVKEGMKLKVNKGEIEMFMQSSIEKVYENKFDKDKDWGWLLHQAKDIFSRRVYVKILSERKTELYKETYALQNYIKQWFKFKRYLPYEEVKGFFPSQAYPSHVKE
ncbi:MAG TPA: hypothetical protein VJI32_00325 [Candidatus Nanoarchaeia archaeon]|nr:hypothetical protein [Candidatus Nanoarchaeia archaeon]